MIGSMRSTLAAALALVVLVGGACGRTVARNATGPPTPSASPAGPAPANSPSASPSPAPIPAAFRNRVPYTPQAPFANWDAAHEHYCTAADLVMVDQFYHGDARDRIPPAEADAKMTSVIAWDRRQWPGVVTFSLTQVALAGKTLFGMQPTIQPVSFEAVQRQVAAGHPVLVALMTHGAPGGAAIAPYYGPADVHHVILITGYDAARGLVYANDPGFMQGQSYAYAWSSLLPAIQAEVHRPDPAANMLSFDRP
jgi:hypothetical protein